MAGLTQTQRPFDDEFGNNAGTKTGKSYREELAGSSLHCPRCGSNKLWRDGNRYSRFNDKIQRWRCRNCKLRFSDPQDMKKAWSTSERIQRIESKSLKSTDYKVNTCQICVKETKNLGPEQATIQNVLESKEDVKGKLIQFAWKMKQQGYAYETIRVNSSGLRALIARGADLTNQISVKEVLAREEKWSPARKRNVITAYTLFLKFDGIIWSKPKCKVPQKFPFIPTEQEIDALIAASGKKNAAFLQVLKETAMCSGEAKRLAWINIDREKNIITLNAPEKGSNPRMWRVTPTLIEMLQALPKTSTQIFTGSLKSMKTTFIKSRKRLAETLQNPRLHRITFHTFRHWKATMLYHQTKDPYYVQHFLGHKSLKSTEIYINIEHTLFEAGANDQFTVRIAEKPEEIKELLEVGFEYVCQKDTLIFLRKRK